MTDLHAMKNLVASMNEYRDAYYNNDESLISDLQYDNLMDQLRALEESTGVVLANSPTRTVGYEVRSSLSKVQHDHPMLSLDKTKDITEIVKFLQNKDAIVMAKMDGLTCSIKYVDGKLVSAETRGDGITGEDITHNMRAVSGVPQNINLNGTVVIDGELIIDDVTFEKVREKFVDNKGKKYKNSRNLASGSVRLLDSAECSKRGVQFVAWKPIQGLSNRTLSEGLLELEGLGFTIVPHVCLTEITSDGCQWAVDFIEELVDACAYPIDGCVFGFDDVEFAEAQGMTSHHLKSQIAFKFYDELYDTVVRSIDWTMGKTGVLTPTAVFDTVEIDGTDVSRASLHNLTIMSQLNVRKNCTARVFKANMIIPQIDSTDNDGECDFEIPTICPVCGYATIRVQDNDSEMLKCNNPNCTGKLLGKLCTFVSKQGMDIDGLGEQTLSQFIELGYLKEFSDIYRLKNHAPSIVELPGFGKSSVDKMLASIEKSRNVTLEKLLASVSIDGVGLDTAKKISKKFDGNLNDFMCAISMRFDFSTLDGFGERSNQLIYQWFDANKEQFEEILMYITIKQETKQVVTNTSSPINGRTFCITGTFEYPRKDIQKEIESCGGIFVSGVTKKTDILFIGDCDNSNRKSSKQQKAEELGIPVIREEHFRAYLSGNYEVDE